MLTLMLTCSCVRAEAEDTDLAARVVELKTKLLAEASEKLALQRELQACQSEIETLKHGAAKYRNEVANLRAERDQCETDKKWWEDSMNKASLEVTQIYTESREREKNLRKCDKEKKEVENRLEQLEGRQSSEVGGDNKPSVEQFVEELSQMSREIEERVQSGMEEDGLYQRLLGLYGACWIDQKAREVEGGAAVSQKTGEDCKSEQLYKCEKYAGDMRLAFDECVDRWYALTEKEKELNSTITNLEEKLRKGSGVVKHGKDDTCAAELTKTQEMRNHYQDQFTTCKLQKQDFKIRKFFLAKTSAQLEDEVKRKEKEVKGVKRKAARLEKQRKEEWAQKEQEWKEKVEDYDDLKDKLRTLRVDCKNDMALSEKLVVEVKAIKKELAQKTQELTLATAKLEQLEAGGDSGVEDKCVEDLREAIELRDHFHNVFIECKLQRQDIKVRKWFIRKEAAALEDEVNRKKEELRSERMKHQEKAEEWAKKEKDCNDVKDKLDSLKVDCKRDMIDCERLEERMHSLRKELAELKKGSGTEGSCTKGGTEQQGEDVASAVAKERQKAEKKYQKLQKEMDEQSESCKQDRVKCRLERMQMEQLQSGFDILSENMKTTENEYQQLSVDLRRAQHGEFYRFALSLLRSVINPDFFI